MRTQPRGFVVWIALMALVALGVLATAVTMLMRPSTELLDERADSIYAQLVLDSALETALWELDKSGTFTARKVLSQGGSKYEVTINAVPNENAENQKTLNLQATRVADPNRPGTETSRVTVKIIKKESGWRAVSYQLRDAENAPR